MFKKIFKNPFVLAFLAGIVFLHVQRTLAVARIRAPEPYVFVEPWQLIDEEGHPFGSKNLKGKIFIANFFFTRCPSICPALIKNMQEVGLRFLGKEDLVHLVSMTVDPEHDTSEVLKEYKKSKDITLENWSFLTGDKQEILDIIMQKMKIHVGEKEMLPGSESLYEIAHMNQFVLFDQEGHLRGLFGTDTTGLSALVRAALLLLAKKP